MYIKGEDDWSAGKKLFIFVYGENGNQPQMRRKTSVKTVLTHTHPQSSNQLQKIIQFDCKMEKKIEVKKRKKKKISQIIGMWYEKV